MQRPLAQENWLGGQVRAADRGGVNAPGPAPFLTFLPFPLLSVKGSLPPGFTATALGEPQTTSAASQGCTTSPLEGFLAPSKERPTLPRSDLPCRAVLCPLQAQSSPPALPSGEGDSTPLLLGPHPLCPTP